MRLFVAIEPPPAARQALRAVQARLHEALRRQAQDLRLTDEGQLHLTLAFIGEVADDLLPALGDAVAAVAACCAPPRLGLGPLGAFPSPARPRIIWAAVEQHPTDAPAGHAPGVPWPPAAGDTGLSAMAALLAEELERLGRPREERPFHAHVTLARVRRGAQLTAFTDLAPGLRPGASSFVAEQLVLFSSQLAPSGPAYRALLRAPIGGGR